MHSSRKGLKGEAENLKLSRLPCLIILTALGLVLVSPASAQQIGPPDTLLVPERTSWENGYLDLFDMDRQPTGARVMAMG